MNRVAYATLIFFAFTGYGLATSTTFEKLNRCVEQKDRACILAGLKDVSAARSAGDFALLASAHMLVGQNQQAVDSIRHANELAPGNFGYLMDQGWIFQRSGDQIDAIRSFLLASKIEPHSPRVFYELGMSFFLSQEWERATRHFEESGIHAWSGSHLELRSAASQGPFCQCAEAEAKQRSLPFALRSFACGLE
jgi:Flp pilus assembly protein TadD